MRFFKLIQCAIAVLTVQVFSLAPATAQAPSTDAYDGQKLKAYFKECAKEYEITTESGETLKMQEQPLMNSQNNERLQDQAGSLFLWESKDGRPSVIGMVFTYWYSGRLNVRHEMLSLSNQGLQANYKSGTAWKPVGPALNFTELKDVAPPGATPVRRLTQMRQIASDFEGELAISKQPVAKLKLITSPLHRYKVPDDGVIDGALFALAVGTDFEILLAIEARKDANGKLTWYWAPARGHYHQLNLKYKDVLVWSVPKIIDLETTISGQMPFATLPYFILTPDDPMPAPEDLK